MDERTEKSKNGLYKKKKRKAEGGSGALDRRFLLPHGNAATQP